MGKTIKGDDGKQYTVKEKKPFYKKVWFWILAVIVIAVAANMGKSGEKENTKTATTTQESSKVEEKKEEKKEEKQEEKKPSVPKEYENALKKAESYSETMHMSKKGIYSQLTSVAEKFSKEAAQYAVDNLKADYKKNALEKAKGYQDTMNMSPGAIKSQLTSNAEKFTEEEAQFAVDNLNK